MSRLTRLSLAHRTVVMLLALLTIGLGVYSAGALKQELIPSMSVPQGAIITVYPGASPAVVEAEVSKPIESAVKAVEGITDVTSTSSSSVSQVSIQWDYDVASDKIASDVNAAIDAISFSAIRGWNVSRNASDITRMKTAGITKSTSNPCTSRVSASSSLRMVASSGIIVSRG